MEKPTYWEFYQIYEDIKFRRTQSIEILKAYVLDIHRLEFEIIIANNYQVCNINFTEYSQEVDNKFYNLDSVLRILPSGINQTQNLGLNINNYQYDILNLNLNITNFHIYTFNSFEI